MDLLRLLYTGAISLEQAQDMFDDQVSKFNRGDTTEAWPQAFGLSKYEVGAYAQGATLQDLAKLRYEGWPSTCSRCHCPIDYTIFGWRFERSGNGDPQLRHIECPSVPCDTASGPSGAG